MNALADTLIAAGLTGRGGASFSTGAKVLMAEEYSADLIVNACDGEVDAIKDAWVVANHLEELVEGARLVTDRTIRFAAHRGSATLAALTGAGVDTLAVPERYVASEESALVNLAHGGPARPLMRWAPVIAGVQDRRGRRCRPTLVLNAETTWRIAQIADRGVSWFRGYGTREEPGPRLVTLAGGVATPGVYPAHTGLTVGQVLGLGGGATIPAQAYWLGGLGGGFLPARAVRTAWSNTGVARFGIGLGAGTVRPVDAREDPWEQVSAAMAYAAGQTAGQCGPCMFGVPALAADVAAVRAGRPEAMGRLVSRLSEVLGRGACRFPDGVAGFVDSALANFSAPRKGAPAATGAVPVATGGAWSPEPEDLGGRHRA